MRLTYDIQTQRGEINGFKISQKPNFSFEYEWLLVIDKVAYKLLSYGGMNENEVLTEEELNEVKAYINDFAPPAPPKPKPPTLEELKQKKLSELNAYMDGRLEAFLSRYPKIEKDSFPFKKQEARAVQKDQALPLEETPVLTALSPIKSIDARNFLATKVLEKVDALAQLEQFGVIKRDEILEATSKKAVEAISWGE